MKKLTILLLLSYCHLLSAQSPTFFTQLSPNDEIIKVIQLKNNQFAYLGKTIGNSFGGWGSEQLFVGILDDKLNQIKYFGKGILPLKERIEPKFFGVTNDSDMLYIGYKQLGCDFGSSIEKLGFLELSTKNFWIDDFWESSNTKQFEDGTIVDLSQNGFTWYEDFIDVNTVSSIKLAANELTEDYFLGKKDIYFTTNQKNWYFTNLEGTKTTKLGKLSNASKIHSFTEVINGKKIAYCALDTLFLVDFEHQKITKTKLKSSEANVVYADKTNELFLNDSEEMIVLDSNFALKRRFPITKSDIGKINGLIVINDVVYYYGNIQHSPQNIPSFYSITSNLPAIKPINTEKANINVAISDIGFANNPPIIQSVPNLGNISNVSFGDITLTLNNTSNDTIFNFNINSLHSSWSMFCIGYYEKTWEFKNTIILPNSTKTVTLNNVQLGYQYANAKDEICYWVSLINGKPDSLLGNNHSCKSFNNTIATEEVLINNRNLSVYPNPAHTTLLIKSMNQTPIEQIEILDLAGKALRTTLLSDSSTETTLNTSDLPSGLYTLKVKQGDVVSINKLIIMN